MSSNSDKQTAAVLACLLAIAGFVAVSMNQTNQHNISEEQAINILKTEAQKSRGLVNPFNVVDGKMVSAELRFATLDWATILDGATHTNLYVNASTTKESEPFWFIEYSNAPSYGLGAHSYGRYIVNADTGAIALAVEDQAGGDVTITPIEPYYGVSFVPNAANVSQALSLPGAITVRITPKDSWVDSIPVYVSLPDLPSDATVTQNVTSVTLRKGVVSGILFKIDVPMSNDFHIGGLKEVHVETRFLQTVRNYTIYVMD